MSIAFAEDVVTVICSYYQEADMFNSYSIRIDMQATGSRIKELRKQKQLKVAELAEIMHSSENTIFKWQRGDCLPTIDNLVVLSTVFDTPMDDIIRVERRGDEPLLPVYGLIINQTVIVIS